MLALLAVTLTYDPRVFDPLRLLYYPFAPRGDATTTTENRLHFGPSAHTDFGVVTLLLTDRNLRLEIYDTAEGKQVALAPNSDAYVINAGNMLSMWTGDWYKSSVHRVMYRKPTRWYSVVFFLDCSLKALDGSQREEEEGLTVEKHMIRRIWIDCSKATRSHNSSRADPNRLPAAAVLTLKLNWWINQRFFTVHSCRTESAKGTCVTGISL